MARGAQRDSDRPDYDEHAIPVWDSSARRVVTAQQRIFACRYSNIDIVPKHFAPFVKFNNLRGRIVFLYILRYNAVLAVCAP